MKKLQFLTEAFSLKEMPKVNRIIGNYLTKMLGGKFVHYSEEFDAEGKSYKGVRYVRDDANMSVRFNYLENNVSVLDSVEIFKADFDKSVSVVEYEEGASIIQVLKGLVATIKGPNSDESVIMENVSTTAMPPVDYVSIALHTKDDNTVAFLKESFSVKSGQLDVTFNDIIDYIKAGNLNGEGDTKTAFSVNIKTPRPYGAALFVAISETFPEMFEIGKRNRFTASSKLDLDVIVKAKKEILERSGFTIIHVGAGRTSKVRPMLRNLPTEIEDVIDAEEKPAELERLTFAKQIEHIKNATNLVVSNISRLMMVVGEGGLGKTHTVIQELKARGLKEATHEDFFEDVWEDDYDDPGKLASTVCGFPREIPKRIAPANTFFVAKGSMSVSEAFKAAWYCREGTIVIDDADNVLLSADGSNLIKGLTDTGTARTIVWKKSTQGVYTSARLAALNEKHKERLVQLEILKRKTKLEPADDLDEEAAEKFYKAREKDKERYGGLYAEIEELLTKEYIPDTFEFKGRVIVISNLPYEKVEPAILTRAITINVQATDDEILDFIKTVVAPRIKPSGDNPANLTEAEKEQLVEVLRRSSRGRLSIRAFVRAVNIYANIKPDGGTIDMAARIISRYA